MPTRLSKHRLSEALPGAALNKDKLNKAGGLGRGRGGRSKGSSGTPCPATLQQTEPRTQAAGSRAQGGRKGSSYPACVLAPALSKPRPAAGSPSLRGFSPRWSHHHRKCKTLQAWGEGWFRTLPSPTVVSPKHPWRQTQLGMPPGLPWGCRVAAVTCMWAPLHAGKEGSSERPSCTRCASSQDGPMIPSLRGLPSVTPDRSSVLSGRKTASSPTVQQGALEVREQMKRCSAVLSCGTRSGVGNGKASTGNLFLFLPSPSPSETFCAQFFPALQADGVSSPGGC